MVMVDFKAECISMTSLPALSLFTREEILRFFCTFLYVPNVNTILL